MTLNIQHDPTKAKFFAGAGGREAYLSYTAEDDSTLDYRRTLVPEEQRHQGVGERIVVHALEYARENRYRVIPTCGFVRWVVEQHPEYQKLLAPEE